MTGWRLASAVLALIFLGVIVPASVASAASSAISATPIIKYRSVDPGSQVDKVIWRGGLVLEGPEKFGGISGITFIDQTRFIMVSDRGLFVSGSLSHSDDGRPKALENVKFTPVTNSKGAPLPKNYSRDSEAITSVYRNGQPVAVRVGFENLTRVADFALVNGRPAGAAREVVIPKWISAIRTNQSLESVCFASSASLIAGSTLLLLEKYIVDGANSGWILGNRDKGPVSLTLADGFKPTDCAFLPDGDLVVLERGIGFLSFTMQVRHIKADQVKAGAVMAGEVILTGYGGDIDNMEGIGVRIAKDGSTRLVIVADNNFNSWERSLLLEFELVE
ncbi:hypothetical protein MNBD_ALPHA12-1728 [hydrothermal vent metagenome]|uniref:Phytase-like domain-containing protein n=1 Tax=hydrothermal vent metagenome TaxID=652676 RepID=A0A3B0US67_9ZZZZ